MEERQHGLLMDLEQMGSDIIEKITRSLLSLPCRKPKKRLDTDASGSNSKHTPNGGTAGPILPKDL